MNIVVGSQNNVKIAAAKQAFTTLYPGQAITVASVNTDSGVRDQPLSTEETMQGAINRARASQNSDADFAVGIEGGIQFITIDGQERGIEASWACVLNCKTGQYSLAASPAYSVLSNVLTHIRTGEDLSSAMQLEYDLPDIGKGAGYMGWLTNNHIDRQSGSFQAVFLALCTLTKETASSKASS